MKLLPCALGPTLTVEEALTLGSNFSSAATLPEKTSEVALGYSGSISSYRTDFLFSYDTFPRFLMRAEPQWIREGRAMRVGDIIVRRAVRTNCRNCFDSISENFSERDTLRLQLRNSVRV
jgi:hypothetical protein